MRTYVVADKRNSACRWPCIVIVLLCSIAVPNARARRSRKEKPSASAAAFKEGTPAADALQSALDAHLRVDGADSLRQHLEELIRHEESEHMLDMMSSVKLKRELNREPEGGALFTDSEQPISKQFLLHKAAEEGDTASIVSLLAGGANIDVKDSDGNTPLHVAAEASKGAAVMALLEAGAGVDKENGEGFTPLHHAAYYGLPEIVEMVLVPGTDLDVQSKEHASTPLIFAALYRHLEATSILLNAGAKVSISLYQFRHI